MVGGLALALDLALTGLGLVLAGLGLPLVSAVFEVGGVGASAEFFEGGVG